MESIQIIRLNNNYFDQLKTLHKQCLADVQYSDETYYKFVSNNYFSYGAINAHNNLLGFIVMMVIYNEGDIISICVAKQHRKCGIASGLLKHCITHLQLTKVFLEVAITNYSAISFYNKHGFTIVSTRKHYFIDGADAFIMLKNVSRETFLLQRIPTK